MLSSFVPPQQIGTNISNVSLNVLPANSASPIVKPKNVMYESYVYLNTTNSMAQKGLNMKSTEAQNIAESIAKNSLQFDYLTLGGHQCTCFDNANRADIITSVQERSYYGRDTGTTGGIVIIKAAKSILVAVYPDSLFSSLLTLHIYSDVNKHSFVPSEIIPNLERAADQIPQ